MGQNVSEKQVATLPASNRAWLMKDWLCTFNLAGVGLRLLSAAVGSHRHWTDGEQQLEGVQQHERLVRKRGLSQGPQPLFSFGQGRGNSSGWLTAEVMTRSCCRGGALAVNARFGRTHAFIQRCCNKSQARCCVFPLADFSLGQTRTCFWRLFGCLQGDAGRFFLPSAAVAWPLG